MSIEKCKEAEENALEALRNRCKNGDVEADHINADDIIAQTVNVLGLHELARQYRSIIKRK
jgi:hypothetical protein